MVDSVNASAGGIAYATLTLNLAANEVRPVYFTIRFLEILSATAAAGVAVSFNGASFFPLAPGLNIADFYADKFWIKDISGAPNTVTFAYGEATVKDNRLVIDAASPLPVTVGGTVVSIGNQNNNADAVATSANNSGDLNYTYGWNGATWDRVRSGGNNSDAQAGIALGNLETLAFNYLWNGATWDRVSGDVKGLFVQGFDAHAAAATAKPVMNAGVTRTSESAALANNIVTRLVADAVGKLITLPYANPENFVSGKTAAMTLVASTAVIAAAGAGVRNYITAITVVNDHATVATEVLILDGATELLRVWVPGVVGTGGPATVHLTFPVPLRGTANTALNAQNVTTGANTYVAASGYKGV